MRGRKPKPTAIKIMEGNPGKRPLNEREPEVAVDRPDAPFHLDDLAREEWDRTTTELLELGVLGRIDRASLAAYCVAWSRWVQAEQQVQDEGFVLTSKEGGQYQHPALAVANKAMEQMTKLAAEFGMTPSSRTRIKVSPSEQKNVSSVLAFVAAGK